MITWSETVGGYVEVSDPIVLVNDCLHLGAQSRLIEAECCGGRTQLKVFGCAVHGDCTIGSQSPGLACCPCDKYDPHHS